MQLINSNISFLKYISAENWFLPAPDVVYYAQLIMFKYTVEMHYNKTNSTLLF